MWFLLAAGLLAASTPGPAARGPIWSFPVPEPIAISSPYGLRSRGMHFGVDFPVPIGTPVRAVARGVVRRVEIGPAAGLFVVIEHPGGLCSQYMHLSSASVRPGQWVRRRRLIGWSGNTGTSTGPHLHLGAIRNGTYQDPMRLLRH